MTQYINKEALVAEIERKIKSTNNDVKIGAIESLTVSKTLNSLISFIDTIKVKEVDLDDHQIADIIQNLFPTNQFIESETLLLDKEEAIIFAKHFYELGLKAQKGE